MPRDSEGCSTSSRRCASVGSLSYPPRPGKMLRPRLARGPSAATHRAAATWSYPAYGRSICGFFTTRTTTTAKLASERYRFCRRPTVDHPPLGVVPVCLALLRGVDLGVAGQWSPVSVFVSMVTRPVTGRAPGEPAGNRPSDDQTHRDEGVDEVALRPRPRSYGLLFFVRARGENAAHVRRR